MDTIDRDISASIRLLMTEFPAVVVLGARQVGKSTLLHHLFPDIRRFDLEKQSDFDLVHHDIEFFLHTNPAPIIFDEAQLSPELFKALRVKIDQNRAISGQYLLSGSSSPELLHHISESLAGRIAICELDPFTWTEATHTPTSRFYDILTDQNWSDFAQLHPTHSFETLIQRCVEGGYPEVVTKTHSTQFRQRWADNYIKTYIERDIRRLFPGLKLDSYRRFIQMLGMSSGQFINHSNLARSLDVSQPTIKSYIDIASGTFLWRHLPVFCANPLKSHTRMPKGYIRDSGLLCFMLNIHSKQTLMNHPHFGFIWECFIAEQILRNLTSRLIPYKAWAYRTDNQSEIDLIIEGPFGVIPIEIKSGISLRRPQLQAITHFMDTHKCPVGIVITNGSEGYQIGPNLVHVPAGCL